MAIDYHAIGIKEKEKKWERNVQSPNKNRDTELQIKDNKIYAPLKAARVADYGNYNNEVILVMAGVMSDKNKQLANDLAIHYIEQFNIGK